VGRVVVAKVATPMMLLTSEGSAWIRHVARDTLLRWLRTRYEERRREEFKNLDVFLFVAD
jgi:hypothetical protein